MSGSVSSGVSSGIEGVVNFGVLVELTVRACDTEHVESGRHIDKYGVIGSSGG